jgi:hypothetical protein
MCTSTTLLIAGFEGVRYAALVGALVQLPEGIVKPRIECSYVEKDKYIEVARVQRWSGVMCEGSASTKRERLPDFLLKEILTPWL